jgi:subtilase-type serine protease
VVIDAGSMRDAFGRRRMIPVSDGLLIALGSGDELAAAVADARRGSRTRKTASKRPRPSSSAAPPIVRRDAEAAHLARIQEGKINAWVQGLGTRAQRNTGYGHDDYDYDTAGVIAGVDFRIGENWLVGGMGGWSRTDMDWVGREGDGQADVAQFGAYAAYANRGWFVDGVFGYGMNWFDTSRGVDFDDVDRMAKSQHEGNQLILRVGGGYLFDVWQGLGLEPTADLAWIRLDHDAISETGAGDVSLEVAGRQADSLRTLVGLRVLKDFKLGKWASVTPELWGGWSHEYLDKNRVENARFVGQSERFLVQGTSTARDAGVIDAGATLFLGRQVSLRASYLGSFSSSDTVHGVTLGLRVRFP